MSRKNRAVAHNSLQTLMQKYKKPFTVDPAFIDCKELSENYTNGLIPMTALAEIVDAVKGSWQGRINQYAGLVNLKPYFYEADKDNVFSHPSFNRDTSPNHCVKLEYDWYDMFAMPSLGLKMPDHYGGMVLNADSTHTSVDRIRQGMDKIPFWVSDVPDMGDFESTFALALLIAGHLFLAINVRNKRGVDIFDQHFIKVATGIYPAPQIDAIVNKVPEVSIKRAGNKIPYAIHNLNETYLTYDLDADSSKPGKLLERSLRWLTTNFKHQSIDGCLMSSFAMFVDDNEQAGITITKEHEQKLANALKESWNTANNAQLSIKNNCILLDKTRPGYKPLDSNYVVSNGLKYIAKELGIPTVRDDIQQWKAGF